MIRFYPLLLLIFLFGCAGHEKQSLLFTGVDVDKSMAIKSSPYISNERVRSLNMGPINTDGIDENYKEKTENKKIIALYLNPGLHKTFAYIPVISCLKRMDLDFHVIAGAEFSAIIAALYAYNFTSEEIDWKLYQMSENLKDKKIYSKEWFAVIEKFINKEFKSKKIQSASKVLAIATYENKSKKIELHYKGNLEHLLLKNVSLAFNKDYSSAVFGNEDDAILELKKKADYIISIDVLGDRLLLNSTNDYLYGVYGKLIGHNVKFETQADLKLKVPLDDFELDTNQIGDVIQVGKEYCKKVEILLNELKEKKED